MNVTLRDLTIYEIDDKRGDRLKKLLRADVLPRTINLDGRGLMVETKQIMVVGGEIIEPMATDAPKKTEVKQSTKISGKTEAWKMAIRRNLQELASLGKYGSWTAQAILNEHQEVRGGEGEMRQISVTDSQATPQPV